MTHAVTYATVLITLYVAHHVGDHIVQTHHQACGKDGDDWPGRLLCITHVATLAATKLVALAATAAVTGIHLTAWAVALGLTVDGISHYFADRRGPLRHLMRLIGKEGFWEFGDAKVAPVGTGAYAIDQSWHLAWLWVAALIIALPA